MSHLDPSQKIRCTGSQPCEVCIRKRDTCTYEASYSRGRAPSPPKRRVVAEPEGNHGLGTDQSISTRPSPEPSQTDRQGHYVGPASSISFLFRVQRRVHQMLQSPPTTSIFTFGDAPLPTLDVSLFFVPPKEDIKHLVDRYFDFAVPTHRYLHRPTVEAWLDEFYATSGSMIRADEAPAKLAVLFMVFAQASLYMPEASSGARTTSDVSVRYYLAADQQLANEKGHVRLASVQARLAQCFYLLAQSRVNHCWTLFGTTSQLVFAIGLHRGKKADPLSNNSTGTVEVECRRNVFWSAYALDKYLSAALGRPRTFRDEDIDQELPSCVDDPNRLSETGRTRPSNVGQPLMRGAIAHIKLSCLLEGILRDLYPIRPLSTNARLALTSPYTIKLKQWYDEYDDFLDSRRINAALLLPIYQRQRNVLNLAYWHATILAHRPFMLQKLESRQLGRNRSRDATIEDHIDEHISLCIDAAMNICNLVTELIEARVMFKAFWVRFYPPIELLRRHGVFANAHMIVSICSLPSIMPFVRSLLSMSSQYEKGPPLKPTIHISASLLPPNVNGSCQQSPKRNLWAHVTVWCWRNCVKSSSVRYSFRATVRKAMMHHWPKRSAQRYTRRQPISSPRTQQFYQLCLMSNKTIRWQCSSRRC